MSVVAATISSASGSATPLARLVAALRGAAVHNPDDTVAPAAVLWTDRAGEWAPILPVLRTAVPELLTLGMWDGAARSGPAIWLKCAVARTLEDVAFPAGMVPIVYLPGVGLRDLRAVEECPRALQPLAELQYRGRTWAQVNGRDWSVLAFLASQDGLGLDVARDAATSEALARVLPKLVAQPIAALTGERIDAEFCDRLLVGNDPVRDVLRWLNEPAAFRAQLTADEWSAFRNVCSKSFAFDPASEGRIGAAERLGQRTGVWQQVWERFAEAPERWTSVPEALRQARPALGGDMFAADVSRGSWPQDNEHDETLLRTELQGLSDVSPETARSRVLELEAEHAPRREWVWATLGHAPLARALAALVALAETTAAPVSGTSRDGMAEAYRNGAWRADAAVLDVLSAVREAEDVQAVRTALRALYLPWLEQAATRLQAYVQASPLPVHDGAPVELPAAGTALLFVDGLRWDVAARLRDRLATRGWAVQDGWRWSALPSVTPTAKPSVSPVTDLLSGDYMAQEFCPNVGASGKSVTTHSFRSLLGTVGVPYLGADETGDPSGRVWTECGDLDGYGHEQGWKLAWRVPEVLAELESRIGQLLAAGFKRVQIVTDHGWLLVPGGLPKTELPGYVADARWARCAMLKDGATPNVPTVPWYWNPHVPVAVAPGVSTFVAGAEYAHGGVTLQECVTPVLEVSSGAAPVRRVTISALKWVGFRCQVQLEGDIDGCQVDVRTHAADDKKSIVGGSRAPDASGLAKLLVSDDRHEGAAAQVVVLDDAGAVIAKRPTTVGDA